MNKLNLAYCNECEDLVEFSIQDEVVNETYKGVRIRYEFPVARCKCCNSEVAASVDYNYEKSEARISAYKKSQGIIGLDEITEIMEKYNVGKEPLALVAGFGSVTIKRYFEGAIPATEYSDRLKELLDNEDSFEKLFELNCDKLNDVSIKKIKQRLVEIDQIKASKINQIANYIIIKMEEVTPLALEKLMAFSNGVNYALNGNRLIGEECQAWQHGYVYPSIYVKYKKYGYKPIDNGINSTHGAMLSLVSEDEIKAIDMVISTFGLYSPKTLEMISHRQEPWIEQRVGCKDTDPCNKSIDEESVKEYYIKNRLDSEENISKYISRVLGEIRSQRAFRF
ncbi:type II toxin-antitoxin system antitoxin SocA domain-containing protein [Butyrivibrio sp. XPD2006]|uniref:type II toxin-antitoxin system antitoxin SocA domain-containing protein n=1 Tax=Butyrivibrio sp. XPD2006 TaxID=1280668 RepID=UPI0003B51DD2|nr:type II toxin-antitoxin system antitoxin SocA domain-containing protein [Butyrivibrio sp. XPD2006]